MAPVWSSTWSFNVSEWVDSFDMANLRDILLLAGIYYGAKSTFGLLSGLFNGFHTYVLPRLWPRDWTKEYGTWAVVTGCTKGIGLSYAQQLAEKGFNLVLIARKEDLLNQISADLKSKYKIETQIVKADFGAGKAIYADIEAALKDKDIGVLINNVGVAEPFGYMANSDPDFLWQIVNVNIGSCVQMTKMVLPQMEKRKKGAIVNIASVAGLADCAPFMTTYGATKAFVGSFTRGKTL